MRSCKRLQILLLAILLFAFTGQVLAFDHLEITVVDPVIVDGYPAATVQIGFSVRVRAVNGDGSTDVAADYVHAGLISPDVLANLPAAQYLQNGEYQFDNIEFLDDGQPVRLQVEDIDDGSVPIAETLINCWHFIDHFSMSVPVGDKFINVAVPVTITALDAFGGTVRNFNDDVVLDPVIGNLGAGATQTVNGASFALGQAVANVTFLGTDPVAHNNTLNAENSILYPGQFNEGAGSVLITPLLPSVINDIMLLLPGETLTPGVPPGKTGSSSAQISGVVFNNIDVYAVDQFWNPVEAGPYPTLTWSSNDASPGVILPPGGLMSSNHLSNQSAALIQSGTRQITATASGAITANSSSNVYINSAGLDHFTFDYAVWDTTDIQVTTNQFQVNIRAEDDSNNLFPYNGPVSLVVRIGESDESADYLITSTSEFVNGHLNALMQVTKRAFSVKIIVDNNAGVIEESGSFQTNAGPLDRIMFTFPGETWTPGLNDPEFNGNMGAPTPVVAGNLINPVTLRPVDEFSNLVSGNRTVQLSCPTGYFMLLETNGTYIPDYMVTINAAKDYWVVLRTYQDQVLQADVSGIDPSTSAVVDVSANQYMKIVVQAPGELLAPGIFHDEEADGKLGEALPQDAGVSFDVTVYATDYNFNPITDIDIALPVSIDFTSSDIAANLPAGTQTLYDNDGDFPVSLLTLANPNEQTVTVKDANREIEGTAIVPVVAGVIDHFDIGINNASIPDPDDALDPIPDMFVGTNLPNVTIIARDVFGNHVSSFSDSVSLMVDIGSDVISPSRISLAAGFDGSGDVFGVWRGSMSITRAGTDVTLSAQDDIYGRTGTSNQFDVLAGSYANLQLIFNGEEATPGLAPGKQGVPLPVTAGDTLTATVIAVDEYWNPVPEQPWVHFESDNYFDMISLNDVQLEADGSSDFDMLLRAAATHTIIVTDLSQPAHLDSSRVISNPGLWEKMILVAPGETQVPGGYEPDGKSGTPDSQVASLQFPVIARAVDNYWNSVGADGGVINLTASDGSLDETNPANNDQPLVAGEIVFPITLPQLGLVDVEVSNSDDPSIVVQSVPIEVTLGAGYRVTVPDTVLAGPPELFEMTVEMVDESGFVLTNAQNSFTLTALSTGLEPAAGELQVIESQLVDGVCVISAQAFDTVSDIFIEVSDDASRTNLSQLMRVDANGLLFDVAVDTENPISAGEEFAVTVEMTDSGTGTIIADNRQFSIDIIDESDIPGVGRVGVISQQLDSGAVTFNQTYTKAENIKVQVWADTLIAESIPFTINNAGYQRLQIVAPGETPAPGHDSYIDTNGKSGTPLQQRASEPFDFSVIATDMFFNRVDSVNSGIVQLSSNDGSFDMDGNPVINNIQFVTGLAEFNNFLVAEGSVVVAASDTTNVLLPPQSVTIETAPAYRYAIVTPETAQTGPVPGFSMGIQLVDPVTELVVETEENTIYLEPLTGLLEPGNGTLNMVSTWLSAGAVTIPDQSYSEFEDLIIRISDGFGREGFSSVIQMQSTGLFFEVSVQETATVGEIFDIDVRLVDGNTGSTVTTMDGPVSIEVFDSGTGLPGDGTLGITQQMLVDGVCTIPQTYSQAGSCWFEIVDTHDNTGISNTCLIQPGALTAIQIIPPGGIDTPDIQQSGIPFTVELVAVDNWLNVVAINNGELNLTVELPATIALVNPDDNNAPFIDGRCVVDIIIEGEGSALLSVDDTTRPEVETGSITIPLNQALYQITLPDPAVVTTGPPSTFQMTVQLVNPDSGLPVVASNSFTMTALKQDWSQGTVTLGVTEATLTDGSIIITDQSYGAGEEIFIEINDDQGRHALSGLLQVVPQGVGFSVAVPDTVTTGQPWTMTVTRTDEITGHLVTNDDRSFTISALNAWDGSPRPDLLLDPAGNLDFTVGTTLDGVAAFASQRYDRAEDIQLYITDGAGSEVTSTVITVLSSIPAMVELETVNDGNPLRPGDTVATNALVTDSSGNPIIGVPVTVSITSGDASLGPAAVSSITVMTDENGYALVNLNANVFGATDVMLEAFVTDLELAEQLIQLDGPPVTELTINGVSREYLDGIYTSFNSSITLTPVPTGDYEVADVWYEFDGVEGVEPVILYEDTFDLSSAIVNQTGHHVLRFFAAETSGVVELVQSIDLYLASAVSSDKPIANHPNPFRAGNETTTIKVNAPNSGAVRIVIYDLYGSTVMTTTMDVTAGVEAWFEWDGRNGAGNVVANGGYICRATGDGFDQQRKIAVIK